MREGKQKKWKKRTTTGTIVYLSEQEQDEMGTNTQQEQGEMGEEQWGERKKRTTSRTIDWHTKTGTGRDGEEQGRAIAYQAGTGRDGGGGVRRRRNRGDWRKKRTTTRLIDYLSKPEQDEIGEEVCRGGNTRDGKKRRKKRLERGTGRDVGGSVRKAVNKGIRGRGEEDEDDYEDDLLTHQAETQDEIWGRIVMKKETRE